MASPLELVFYVGFPYVAIVLFFFVPIYRKLTNDIEWDWTTRASGLFGNRTIGIASTFLHWGLLLVFVGHVLGLAGTELQEVAYVDLFYWIGAIGGVAALFGSLLALVRRVVNARMRAMSTSQDYVIHVFLSTILGIGLYQALILNLWGLSYGGFAWLVSLFTLSPDVSSIAALPLVTQVHIIVSMLFWAYFPFTKLVHLWSIPLGYLVRPYISMRGYESAYPGRKPGE